MIKNTIRLLVDTITKLSHKKSLRQRNKTSDFELKWPSNINKAKAFNKLFMNVNYRQNQQTQKPMKKLSTEEIVHNIIQVQLAISNNKNNSTAPDGINIRDLKHLEPFSIKYFTKVYKTALNTNTITTFWETSHNHSLSKTKQGPQNRHKLIIRNTFITPCQKTVTIHNRKQFSFFYQYEFKHKHSTHTALHSICHQITKCFNDLKQHRTVAVALDII